MNNCFAKKLDELINLARYRKSPLVEAHLILTRKCLDESNNNPTSEEELKEILILLAGKSIKENRSHVSRHLIAAVDALESEPDQESDKIFHLDFGKRAKP